MRKISLLSVLFISISNLVFAYNQSIEETLENNFQNAWKAFCHDNQIPGQTVADLGLVWSGRVIVDSVVTNVVDLDDYYNRLAHQFMGDHYSGDIFAKDSFVRVVGDYLEKQYNEIIDIYIQLTEKELEKRGLLGLSHIKNAVRRFKQMTALQKSHNIF